MNPVAICPVCKKPRDFHPDEMKKVRKGKARCTECMLDRVFYEFLAEVLNGEHAELIAEMRARMEEEAGEDDSLYI